MADPAVVTQIASLIDSQNKTVVPVTTVKPGYKTTEFWLTLAVTVFAGLQTTFGPDTTTGKIISAAVMILGVLGYTAARTSAKNA